MLIDAVIRNTNAVSVLLLIYVTSTGMNFDLVFILDMYFAHAHHGNIRTFSLPTLGMEYIAFPFRCDYNTTTRQRIDAAIEDSFDMLARIRERYENTIPTENCMFSTK